MILIMIIVGGLACGPKKAPLVPTSVLGQTIIGLCLIYMFIFNLGWGPLAWAVATEQCVGRNRPKIMAVSTAVFWICSWLVTFTLPYLFTTAKLGAKIGFIYGGGCVFSWLFVYFVLPETKGRSLEELEEMYRDGISSHKFKGHKTRIETDAHNIVEGKTAEVETVAAIENQAEVKV
jgi:SP family sugar:H+ symporter-like MFS transporter